MTEQRYDVVIIGQWVRTETNLSEGSNCDVCGDTLGPRYMVATCRVDRAGVRGLASTAIAHKRCAAFVKPGDRI